MREKFTIPNDKEIEERYTKGASINYGWHILKGLEVISCQLDVMSKKIREGLKAVSSRVMVWNRRI